MPTRAAGAATIAWNLSEKNLKTDNDITFIYLFISLATFQCIGAYVNCGGSSPIQLCVGQYAICDGHANNCGNGWDEDPERCGEFAYWLIY